MYYVSPCRNGGPTDLLRTLVPTSLLFGRRQTLLRLMSEQMSGASFKVKVVDFVGDGGLTLTEASSWAGEPYLQVVLYPTRAMSSGPSFRALFTIVKTS